jgi:hypothetical protein
MYKKMHLDKRQDVATNTNVDTKLSAHDAVSGITFLMLFNATFNNISIISLRSVILVEETEVPGENHDTDLPQVTYKFIT